MKRLPSGLLISLTVINASEIEKSRKYRKRWQSPGRRKEEGRSFLKATVGAGIKGSVIGPEAGDELSM